VSCVDITTTTRTSALRHSHGSSAILRCVRLRVPDRQNCRPHTSQAMTDECSKSRDCESGRIEGFMNFTVDVSCVLKQTESSPSTLNHFRTPAANIAQCTVGRYSPGTCPEILSSAQGIRQRFRGAAIYTVAKKKHFIRSQIGLARLFRIINGDRQTELHPMGLSMAFNRF
jgi:hypothetical protein